MGIVLKAGIVLFTTVYYLIHSSQSPPPRQKRKHTHTHTYTGAIKNSSKSCSERL